MTIGLAVVSAVFWVLERRRPSIRHQRRQPADTRLDLAYFPFIDLAFGTFYMPPGREPEHFGILGDDVPGGLLARLAYPFRGWRSRAAAGALGARSERAGVAKEAVQ